MGNHLDTVDIDEITIEQIWADIQAAQVSSRDITGEKLEKVLEVASQNGVAMTTLQVARLIGLLRNATRQRLQNLVKDGRVRREQPHRGGAIMWSLIRDEDSHEG